MTSIEKRLQASSGKRVILFSNMLHHDGINVTVRRGGKHADLRQGQEVLLADLHGESAQVAVIICVARLPFHAVPEAVLPHEHDPGCRTKEGLFYEMKRVYDGFLGTEEVTIVFYYIKESPE
ncbi:MAG: hypothetical protein GY906_28380 [bacterium]|nr:hypothetical protein [bacterium]